MGRRRKCPAPACVTKQIVLLRRLLVPATHEAFARIFPNGPEAIRLDILIVRHSNPQIVERQRSLCIFPCLFQKHVNPTVRIATASGMKIFGKRFFRTRRDHGPLFGALGRLPAPLPASQRPRKIAESWRCSSIPRTRKRRFASPFRPRARNFFPGAGAAVRPPAVL